MERKGRKKKGRVREERMGASEGKGKECGEGKRKEGRKRLVKRIGRERKGKEFGAS